MSGVGSQVVFTRFGRFLTEEEEAFSRRGTIKMLLMDQQVTVFHIQPFLSHEIPGSAFSFLITVSELVLFSGWVTKEKISI